MAAGQNIGKDGLCCVTGQMKSDFALTNQIRRASLSCMNNIAEGFGRFSNKEFIRFLEISSASANEVKSLGYTALDLNYWEEKVAWEVMNKVEYVKSLDLKFIKYLRRHSWGKSDYNRATNIEPIKP